MNMNSKKKISLIAPFYNECNGVEAFFNKINEVFDKLKNEFDFEVICVNDGSKDDTLSRLVGAKNRFEYIKIIDFSRNFGKEAAITAGLDYASGDAVIPIDSDLQHPPELIIEMLTKWKDGYEVVLAKRMDRNTDHILQRFTANLFYRFNNKISHIHIPRDVGDYRLMDRKVVESLKLMTEKCRFMKGIFSWVGYKTTTIEYKVLPREFGKSSFNTWKLWNFALEGITGFSTVPLRMWTYLGFFVSMLSFLYAMYLFFKTIILGVETPGYASVMVAIFFFSGVQLIGIGVLGEYIGRIFSEVKQRPIYIIREFIQ
ncbi:glycosyl transferase 2 family protein [Escherichia coli 1-182-04_S3_C1]|nr:glycosyl transferase 2 family protein [Escherichia coli 1-182-04_S3_C1]